MIKELAEFLIKQFELGKIKDLEIETKTNQQVEISDGRRLLLSIKKASKHHLNIFIEGRLLVKFTEEKLEEKLAGFFEEFEFVGEVYNDQTEKKLYFGEAKKLKNCLDLLPKKIWQDDYLYGTSFQLNGLAVWDMRYNYRKKAVEICLTKEEKEFYSEEDFEDKDEVLETIKKKEDFVHFLEKMNKAQRESRKLFEVVKKEMERVDESFFVAFDNKMVFYLDQSFSFSMEKTKLIGEEYFVMFDEKRYKEENLEKLVVDIKEECKKRFIKDRLNALNTDKDKILVRRFWYFPDKLPIIMDINTLIIPIEKKEIVKKVESYMKDKISDFLVEVSKEKRDEIEKRLQEENIFKKTEQIIRIFQYKEIIFIEARENYDYKNYILPNSF